MKLYFALCFAALIYGALCGCTQAELDRIDPPIDEPRCDGMNPWKCPDGHSCCSSYRPLCMGPDATGYYCERPYNPDNEGTFSAARVHARRMEPSQ